MLLLKLQLTRKSASHLLEIVSITFSIPNKNIFMTIKLDDVFQLCSICWIEGMRMDPFLSTRNNLVTFGKTVLWFTKNMLESETTVEFNFCRLTSLMLDFTVMLRNVLYWDEGHVVETVKWLAKQQKEDGSFVEDKAAIVLRNDLVKECFWLNFCFIVISWIFCLNRTKNLITFHWLHK